MSEVLRIAIRKFGPFESAIRKQFEHFRASTGSSLKLDVDTLRYQANEEPRFWHDAALGGRWIPDAFIGPMASLMEAI
jgi:multiple sugar transport system substrate-binding protein